MGVTLRSRKLKDGSKSFYLDIIHNGSRWSETLDLVGSRGNLQSMKEQAITIRDTRSIELSAQNFDVVPVTVKKKSFIKFWEDYLAEYTKGDRTSIKSSLKHFKAFNRGKDITFGQVDEQICRDFKKYLLTCKSTKGEPLRGETASNYFARFKKILKEANIKRLMKIEPAKFVTLPLSQCPPTEPKMTLTKKEILTLVKTDCKNEVVKRAFLFCCITGLRTSEVRTFNAHDIQYNYINDRFVPHIDIAQKKGINPKHKLIPLNDFAMALLGDFNRKTKEPFFKLPTQNAVNKCIKKWLIEANIRKHITFYCARHSCATILVAAKVDLRTVIGISGHSSFKYIMRYVHEVDENKVDAVKKLDLFDEDRTKLLG